MHLLQIKKSTSPEMSWKALQLKSGIHRSNLCKIAHGERGWDVGTGAALMEKLGVDLNEQMRVYIRRQRQLAKSQKIAS